MAEGIGLHSGQALKGLDNTFHQIQVWACTRLSFFKLIFNDLNQFWMNWKFLLLTQERNLSVMHLTGCSRKELGVPCTDLQPCFRVRISIAEWLAPCSGSHLDPFLAVWPWVSYVTALCLSFLICTSKRSRIILLTSQVYCNNKLS